MSRPVLLDLFSCEGVAADGYARAGWDVYALDLDRNRLSHNPYPTHHGDALEALDVLLDGGALLFQRPDGSRALLNAHDIDAFHASPPCQSYTRGNAGRVTKWPRLIEPVRERLAALGAPHIIENVEDAAPFLVDPVRVCGCMFDLSTIDTDGVQIHLQRPRMFESNAPLSAPRACDHSAHDWVAGAYGGARRDKYEAKYVRKGGYVPPSKAVVGALLGVDRWDSMTWQGLFECIPPAYTEHLGRQLLAALADDAQAA